MVAEREREPIDAEPSLLVSVPQAARLLGIGTTLAWALVHAGVIPSVKLGRRVLVSRRALEQLAQDAALTLATAPGGQRHPASPLQSEDRSPRRRAM